MNPYTQAEFDILDSHYRIHGNAEQTHVVIVKADEREFIAIAYDIDPKEYTAIAGECIGYAPTLDGVREKAKRWMQNNPKGIAYSESSEKSGFLQKVWGALKSLDDYGNNLINQQGGGDN